MQKIDRINEKRKMKNGMDAVIICYRNAHDIDVEFGDGKVVCHKTYRSFLKGDIRHPDGKACNGHFVHQKERLGETREMRTGDKCTIIAYENSHDITVRFDNGDILYHRYYRDFVHGRIRDMPEYTVKEEKHGSAENPGTSKKERLKNYRIGQKKEQKYGNIGEITEYAAANDITVRFSDGSILQHARYDKFVKGSLASPLNMNPKIKKEDAVKQRVGEKVKTSCGLYAMITEYRGSLDIDVTFQDGAIVKNIVYDAFRKGNVAHPVIRLHSINQSYGRFLIIKHAFTLEDNNAYYIVRDTETGRKNIISAAELARAYTAEYGQQKV